MGRQWRSDENVHEARVNPRSWQDGGFVEGLRGSLCLLNRKKTAIARITHLGREKQERRNPWFIWMYREEAIFLGSIANHFLKWEISLIPEKIKFSEEAHYSKRLNLVVFSGLYCCSVYSVCGEGWAARMPSHLWEGQMAALWSLFYPLPLGFEFGSSRFWGQLNDADPSRWLATFGYFTHEHCTSPFWFKPVVKFYLSEVRERCTKVLFWALANQNYEDNATFVRFCFSRQHFSV